MQSFGGCGFVLKPDARLLKEMPGFGAPPMGFMRDLVAICRG